MEPAGDLLKESSTVINQVLVSDPSVDIQREQVRQSGASESPPAKNAQPATASGGLSLVGSEGVDDGGRGGLRSRHDYNGNSVKRKELTFGHYVLGQTLGEGEFGKVKLGWKRDGTIQVAIKLIRREVLGSNPSRLPKIYREISILRDLAHPNIVRLHEMVETDRHIGIIMEYASGGELFDHILNNRYLKDNSARRLFAQLISGVGYLHKKGIVHRDLKLENLLLDRNRNIIITDFGFANTFDPADELSEEIEYNLTNKDFVKKTRLDKPNTKGMRRGDLMQTSCGSPCYAAPELVVSDSLYTGRKVDVWSCGVILYAMLAGYLPFDDDPANPDGDNINLLYKYIVTTPLTFPEYVTPHARDLLRRILVPDPRKRADLFEVARHSWLNEYAHIVSHITSSTTMVSDIANATIPLGMFSHHSVYAVYALTSFRTTKRTLACSKCFGSGTSEILPQPCVDRGRPQSPVWGRLGGPAIRSIQDSPGRQAKNSPGRICCSSVSNHQRRRHRCSRQAEFHGGTPRRELEGGGGRLSGFDRPIHTAYYQWFYGFVQCWASSLAGLLWTARRAQGCCDQCSRPSRSTYRQTHDLRAYSARPNPCGYHVDWHAQCTAAAAQV